MYSAWPVNQNDWRPMSKAAPQLTSNIKLSLVRGAPPRAAPLLASMKAVRSVFRNTKPGTSQEIRAPGQILQDVGIAVDVDAADEGDVPDGSTADHPVRQLTEAQRRIPLAVEVLVVEAVGAAVVEDVDEDEAVAECPA